MVVALLLACADPADDVASTAEPAAPEVVVSPDADGLGWVSRVAYVPASFADLTATGRDGWIALHANDPKAAVEAFAEEPIGRARAELALVVLYEDLARVSGVAADQLFTQWASKGGLPPGPDAPMVAALAAACSDGESAGSWASKVDGGPDATIAQAMAQGRAPFDVSSSGPYGRRLALHRQARASGDPAPLVAALATPIATLQEKTFERRFWDPCGPRTLARLWLEKAARDLGGNGWRSVGTLARPASGLAGTFLAPWATPADLEAELSALGAGATEASLGLLGARGPTVRRLGVGATPSPSDDPEVARRDVQTLDAGLDAWGRKILDQAPEEGQAVVSDLSLLPRFRQEWLATRARLALSHGEPRTALTYAELARDHSAPGIGTANGASVYLVAAEAQLRLGHTREALDLLHVVTAAYPEAVGVEETAGDLAVLQGLDRHGDSKEDL